MKSRIYTLTNGLRVANFSSPHPFYFTDRTLVPAVEDEKARNLMLEVKETRVPQRNAKYQLVSLDWSLSESVADEIDYWFTFFAMKEVDVVIVPLPVMKALKSIWNPKDIVKSPFRVIRVADRVSKAIHIDKFCI